MVRDGRAMRRFNAMPSLLSSPSADADASSHTAISARARAQSSGGFGRLLKESHGDHPFSAIVDLASLASVLDVFDLTKLVVEMGLSKPISDKAMAEDKRGDLSYAQAWLLCVTASCESPDLVRKKFTREESVGILKDAMATLESSSSHKARSVELQSDLLMALGSDDALGRAGKEAMKLLRAMRMLSISDMTLMDDELRSALVDATEEGEQQLRAAGLYEDGKEKEEVKAALSHPARKPTSTLRQPSRLVMMEWGAYALNRGAVPGADESVYDGDLYSQIADDLFAQTHPKTNGISSEAMTALKHAAENAVTIGAVWGSCGFPQVVPTHKLAAALMATDPPPSAEEVRLPWPTFAVIVPNGLLPSRDPIEVVDCIGIATNEGERPAVWLGRKNNGIVTANAFQSLDELFKCAGEDEVATLLMRLLVGVILEMDSPSQRQLVREQGVERKSKRRSSDKLSAWTFELRRDVKVDCRTWVKDYIASGGTSPSVRSLTRGHQKRQRYGPKGALRKWIHVEPYWRGPMDGPVAVKSHKIGD